MFKIGDVVEITKESSSIGVLDLKDGKGYEVLDARVAGAGEHTTQVYIRGEGGNLEDWYAASHFKLKEDLKAGSVARFSIGDAVICIETVAEALSMNSITEGKEYIVKGVWGIHNCNVVVVGDGGEEVGVLGFRFKLKEDTKVEKKECLFKEGQVVWDIVRGRGVIRRVDTEATRSIGAMPVIVVFDSGEQRDYSYEGVSNFPVAPTFMGKRTLFFSEPKIEAATEPLFEPTLKKGDVVVLSDKEADYIANVVSEDEGSVYYKTFDGVVTYVDKNSVIVYRLGEKINFK